MQKSRPGLSRRKDAPCMIPYTVQATFILSNYYDIDKVIAEKQLKGIVDTLEGAPMAKKWSKEPYGFPHSIVYNPYYNGKNRMQQFNRLISDEYDVFPTPNKRNTFTMGVNIGAGLIRNTVAPLGELSMQFSKYTKWNHKNYDYFKVSVTPYFLFDRDAQGNYLMNDNWFLNLDIGSVYESNAGRWLGKKASTGISYLVVNKGGYFRNNTFKLFTDLEVVSRFTISPEIIFTNNFKQIFPGITVKVF